MSEQQIPAITAHIDGNQFERIVVHVEDCPIGRASKHNNEHAICYYRSAVSGTHVPRCPGYVGVKHDRETGKDVVLCTC
ncbi:hypothetical protein H1S01_03175 [Heliobacterium chlorum]|uniref:Uncharacterized protein n=1 Tax=Heliobacterium chlorum TaxID=2698 RepID=A0ABR7SYA4_HELCL|nr:hypothetical protein [Heliobacterium chlorum]MBC9783513.1 hypothetical protein [Heliobacterium chlorum]